MFEIDETINERPLNDFFPLPKRKYKKKHKYSTTKGILLTNGLLIR